MFLSWRLQTIWDSTAEDSTDRLSVGSVAVSIDDLKGAASGRDKVCYQRGQQGHAFLPSLVAP